MSDKILFEFFAGGGMARLGLGPSWTCAFANDFDRQKAAAYKDNFPGAHLREEDVNALYLSDLPAASPTLVWSSFPCQDLSLAGARKGLKGERSSAFHGFWDLVTALACDNRAPEILVLENVAGLVTANGGQDFTAIVNAIARAGYSVSALMIDAQSFTPQSRRRIFLFGFKTAPTELFGDTPPPSAETPAALIKAAKALPSKTRAQWRWLTPRPHTKRNVTLADILEPDATWLDKSDANKLFNAMAPTQKKRLEERLQSGARFIGAGFRRIRKEDGKRVQRFEVRFDDIAGCLRTPAGGSSRQFIVEVDKGAARARLLTPREAARLMGLPDEYRLPASATAALKLSGDGVCVPAVQWINEAILTPALNAAQAKALPKDNKAA